jgi:hypothetical protein
LREVTILNTQNKEDGKGIIYKMIDEWGNEASYDFKNIMYLYNTGDSGN